jgi:penicillin-binding protein 1A
MRLQGTGMNQSRLLLMITLIAGAMVGVAGGSFFALTYDMPQIRSLENFRPSAVTRIHSADDKLLAELFVERRMPIGFDQIPKPLIEALLATEDRNFYRHGGVDLKGILRAVFRDILAGEFVEGASTITQQLAKTLFLDPQKTILRKLKEALLSVQLERRYTKNEILALYLNQVYFGSGAYGVSAAAQTFFGKPLDRLTLAECALIAAMPKSPSKFSPLVNLDLARRRRDIVLRQMRETGKISAQAFETAMGEHIAIDKRHEPRLNAPYFIDYIKEILEEQIGPQRIYKGGLTVWTTLSLELQQAAETAVKKGLQEIETRFNKQEADTAPVQCGFIALDIPSGGILAMVGSREYKESPYNRAVSAIRQPGSAFKPIVFAAALAQGFTQSSRLLDAPVVFKGAQNGTDWRPENYSKTYSGEVSLRKSLAQSKNIPAVRLMEMLGPASVVSFAHALGIDTALKPNLSLALGTSEVRLIDLTAAYAIFPNQGCRIPPFGVLEITDHQGNSVWRAAPDKRIVMPATDAAVMTDILRAVILEGTAGDARRLSRPLGGKTGTTDQYKDAWFIGFSPTIAAGVWIGRDENTPIGEKATGAGTALPIWMDFMEKALTTRPYQTFDLPGDVVKAHINPATGVGVAPDDKEGVVAVFKKGTEPRR